MKVWIRISSGMAFDSDFISGAATKLEVSSNLDLVIYATKEAAKKAQETAGGIVLEVDVSCLMEVDNEFGNEVLLSSVDKDEGRSATTAAFSIACEGVLDTESQMLQLSEDAETWLGEFQNETGFYVYQ